MCPEPFDKLRGHQETQGRPTCALSLSKGAVLSLSKGTLAALCGSCGLSTTSVDPLGDQWADQDDQRVPWVYILRCADDSFYVGSTRDLESRLQQHAIGRVDAFTKSRRPVALAWAQECEHIEDAYLLEHKIKGWRREKKLALIKGSYSDLPRLSRSGSHKPKSAQVP
jgi:tRNA/rRNA methyltransferase/putative endonuclease